MKKYLKKSLAIFLTVAICITTISMGLSVLAADITVANIDKAVIAVPETVYMTPNGGAATLGQYYVNNTVTSGSYTVGLEASAANTNGYVQFYIPGAKDVAIAVNTVTPGIGDIVLAEAGQSSGSYENASLASVIDANGYFDYKTAGLYINGTGLTPGQTALAEWVFTVTMSDDSVRTYYAYSTLYSPHRSVGAVSEARRSGTYNNEISSWISGINGLPGGWSPITTGGGDKTAAGYFKNDPLWSGLPSGGGSESADDFITVSDTDLYVEAKATNGADGSRAVGYLGSLMVDSSRYTNTNQIPNLKIGGDVLRVNSGKKDSLHEYDAWYVLGDNSYKIGSGYGDRPSGWTVFDTVGNEPQKTSRDTVIPAFSVDSINGKYIHTASQGECNNWGVTYSNACASVICYTVDKAGLRQFVLQGTSLNANNYTKTTWDAYQTQLRNAAQNLGNPSNNVVDTSALTSARDELKTTVTLNANGGSIGTNSFDVTVGTVSTFNANVSSYVPTRDGFTFKGWATSPSATSGSTSSVSVGLKPTLYATWEVTKYDIKWIFADGTEKTETLANGTSLSAPANSTKVPDAEYHYAYSWTPSVSTTVTGNATYKEELKSIPHSWSDWKEITSPGCTTTGEKQRSCNECGYAVTEVVSVLGHKYQGTITAPTCTEKGFTTYVCSVCGDTYKDHYVAATGHSMGDWVVTKYPTFDASGLKTKSCANCDYSETEVLNPVKLRTTRIISSEIDGNTITITGYTNADSIGFYRTTAAGEDIIFDMYYDEEDLANAPTPIKYGDNSPRWIIYNSRWAQYAVDGKYTDKVTIAGVEYNFEVIMNSRELEANDVVLTEKFTNIDVDNENKVITLIPPKGTESVTMKQTSRQYDEFTYTIDADSYDNVTLNAVSGAYRGSYTISANGEFETEVTVTVNKGKYCQEDYTLKVIFIDFDLVSELRPLRGNVSLETYEDGREYIKVTMADGQSSTGIYKTGKGAAITDVKVELADGNMTEKDNLYVGYAKSNKSNPTGEVTISLSNGSVLTYDIVFDMGIVETTVDPLAELKLIRSTASFDADGTLRITRNAGLAESAGAGLYATTTAGETVTFTTEQGTVYAGRTDAFIAYLTQNTSNVKGTISYTLSDGTVVEYKAVIDLGLGDEYVEPEEPAYDIATDLRTIRGTVSVTDNTVTITVTPGKTMTGIYNTTNSGATVEITTENGIFADRTDAYVAYIATNTANVEGTMTVTLADGTVNEYTVIFDLGL